MATTLYDIMQAALLRNRRETMLIRLGWCESLMDREDWDLAHPDEWNLAHPKLTKRRRPVPPRFASDHKSRIALARLRSVDEPLDVTSFKAKPHYEDVVVPGLDLLLGWSEDEVSAAIWDLAERLKAVKGVAVVPTADPAATATP